MNKLIMNGLTPIPCRSQSFVVYQINNFHNKKNRMKNSLYLLLLSDVIAIILDFCIRLLLPLEVENIAEIYY